MNERLELREALLQESGIQPNELYPLCWHKVKRILDTAAYREQIAYQKGGRDTAKELLDKVQG